MEPRETKKEKNKKFLVSLVVDENTLVVNIGRDDGIRDGQRFLFYELGQELKDPETGDSLGQLELVIGTGKATHIQDKMTTVRSDMTTTPSRTVRRNRGGRFTAIDIFGKEEVEEFLPGDPIPFENAKVGTLVKLI